MGTVHSLADARKRRLNVAHETKALNDAAAIVKEYYDSYLLCAQEYGELVAALKERKEKLQGPQGWFRRLYLKPTTNMIQHALDTCKYRMNFRYQQYKDAKQAFDEEKDKIDRRFELLIPYSTVVFSPRDID